MITVLLYLVIYFPIVFLLFYQWNYNKVVSTKKKNYEDSTHRLYKQRWKIAYRGISKKKDK